MWNVILDAFLDTLKLFPFLFLLYILIELMEHNTRVGKPSRLLSGKYAPLIGSATGLVPMCGFSVMAAKLYEHRHVTLGALFAVFISTSDEGILVLLLSPMPWGEKLLSVAALCGVKFILGVGIGYLIDMFVARKKSLAPLPEPHVHEHEHEHEAHMSEHAHGHEHMHEGGHMHGHGGEHVHEHEYEDAHEQGECECAELSVCEHKKESTLRLYFVSPLLHALEVAAFVFIVNFLFGALFFSFGEARVTNFLQGNAYWAQPALCALVGLIPSCASSVILAEVYAVGGIAFGGLLAGLVVNAGLGYLVLFRSRKSAVRALLIIFSMIMIGIAVGYAASAIQLLI